MILHTTEHVDGSGYPTGVDVDPSSSARKVIAVADVVAPVPSPRGRPRCGTPVLGAPVEDRWYDAEVIDACLALFRGPPGGCVLHDYGP